ncbi:hypothetical protein NQ317_012731 [Molorchus minor]|uniref:Uncharacterized protein n=1 Tax=Molorchus minor TaxID=1323400 RepID=A0ABQ9JM28_9CUCU|nr:hypothetical protein NQ317_012731 [Molorchus minor]
MDVDCGDNPTFFTEKQNSSVASRNNAAAYSGQKIWGSEPIKLNIINLTSQARSNTPSQSLMENEGSYDTLTK